MSVHKLLQRDPPETSRGPIGDWRYVAAGMAAVLPVVIAIIVLKLWGGL
jgi:hypothetical protein